MGIAARHLGGHQLYYFGSCPWCILVRVALWWLGLEVVLKETLFNPAHNAELIAGGGKSQVPCLRIESADGDARWLYESIDIIRYLRARSDT
jgi:glutathione S-transferase